MKKLLFFVSVFLLSSFCISSAAYAIDDPGKPAVLTARNNYASVSVTTGAWVQLVAATPVGTTKSISEIEIFDSSGQTLQLGFGGAGSEVAQIYILPGGNGKIPLMVPSNTRISIKAVSATASVGEIDINFYH